MWREESEKSSEFPMEIETTTFESQNRFHCKLYLKMLPNLVKKNLRNGIQILKYTTLSQ